MNFKQGFEKTALLGTVGKVVTLPAKAALKAGKYVGKKAFGGGLGGLANVGLTVTDALGSGLDTYRKITTAR